jgi:methyltransferase (TIGR00027 family)
LDERARRVQEEAAKPDARSREAFAEFLKGVGRTTIDGKPVEASRTAFITAFMRAFHSANEAAKIFDDWRAAQLLTAEEYAFFEEMYYWRTLRGVPAAPAPPAERRAVVRAAMRAGAAGGVLSRARFAEDALERAVAAGVRQYVLLGAGFDTFALRRCDLLEDIRVIEVDHPATQAVKRQRLAATGVPLPPSLHFVAVDFSQEDLPHALSRSLYDPDLPAFFSWLGVTYYLEREDLFKVLQGLAETAAPQSLLAFDYMDVESFDPARTTSQVQELKDSVRLLGEPMKTGLDPATLARDLRAVGWELREDLSSQDIEGAYFRGGADGWRTGKHIHLALAALPGEPRRPSGP